jgi:predicted ArsR family transcriptional regulator
MDYENIRYMINSFAHGTSFKPLSLARKEIIDNIKTSFEFSEFSISDCASSTGLSYESARRHLKELTKEKLCENNKRKRSI